jgi:hypothetical protein
MAVEGCCIQGLPGFGLKYLGHSVLQRRSLLAWAVWMKLRHHTARSWRKQMSNAPQDADWILDVMQDHRNQRRIRRKTERPELGSVCNDAPNLRHSSLFLKAL